MEGLQFQIVVKLSFELLLQLNMCLQPDSQLFQPLLHRKTGELRFSLLATILLTLTTCFGWQLCLASFATTALLHLKHHIGCPPSMSLEAPDPEFKLIYGMPIDTAERFLGCLLLEISYNIFCGFLMLQCRRMRAR